MVLVARNSRSSGSSASARRYVVCLSNDGYPASLEVRKIYTVLPDREARKIGLIRVIDESGEDYLFPEGCFAEIKLPRDVAKALPG